MCTISVYHDHHRVCYSIILLITTCHRFPERIGNIVRYLRNVFSCDTFLDTDNCVSSSHLVKWLFCLHFSNFNNCHLSCLNVFLLHKKHLLFSYRIALYIYFAFESFFRYGPRRKFCQRFTSIPTGLAMSKLF